MAEEANVLTPDVGKAVRDGLAALHAQLDEERKASAKALEAARERSAQELDAERQVCI